jgi:hypothetical protein
MVGDVDLGNKYLMNIPSYTKNALSVMVIQYLTKDYTFFSILLWRTKTIIHIGTSNITILSHTAQRGIVTVDDALQYTMTLFYN